MDIDPSIVTIATDWFGFKEDDSLRCHVADGLEFIQKEVEKGKKFIKKINIFNYVSFCVI